MISPRPWRIPAVVAFCTSIFAAPPAPNSDLAAPWIIIIHGDLLPERVVIADWHENLAFLASIDVSTVADTPVIGERPYLDFAMFWGAHWKEVAESPEALAQLRPNQGNQHGRFYPGLNGANALAYIGPALGRGYSTVGQMTETGLALLKRYDVPVRIDS